MSGWYFEGQMQFPPESQNQAAPALDQHHLNYIMSRSCTAMIIMMAGIRKEANVKTCHTDELKEVYASRLLKRLA